MRYVTTINYENTIYFNADAVAKEEHFSEVYPNDSILPFVSYFLPSTIWNLSVIVALSGDGKMVSLICKYTCYGNEEDEFGEFPHLEMVNIFDVSAKKVGFAK